MINYDIDLTNTEQVKKFLAEIENHPDKVIIYLLGLKEDLKERLSSVELNLDTLTRNRQWGINFTEAHGIDVDSFSYLNKKTSISSIYLAGIEKFKEYSQAI